MDIRRESSSLLALTLVVVVLMSCGPQGTDAKPYEMKWPKWCWCYPTDSSCFGRNYDWLRNDSPHLSKTVCILYALNFCKNVHIPGGPARKLIKQADGFHGLPEV